jgi:hypothetical protein
MKDGGGEDMVWEEAALPTPCYVVYHQQQALSTTAEPRRLHNDDHAAFGAVILCYHGVFTLLEKLIRAIGHRSLIIYSDPCYMDNN